MILNKLLITGTVLSVLFISGFSAVLIMSQVDEAKEAKHYCESRNKVVVKSQGDYFCVYPEDRV